MILEQYVALMCVSSRSLVKDPAPTSSSCPFSILEKQTYSFQNYSTEFRATE